MGADLCIAVVAARRNKTLDWEAGHRRIDELEREARKKAIQEDPNLTDEDVVYLDEDRYLTAEEGHEKLNDLEVIVAEEGRDVVALSFGDHTIWLSGGMSWGDPPTDSYDTIGDLYKFDGVLEAVGFEWPEPTETATT